MTSHATLHGIQRIHVFVFPNNAMPAWVIITNISNTVQHESGNQDLQSSGSGSPTGC